MLAASRILYGPIIKVSINLHLNTFTATSEKTICMLYSSNDAKSRYNNTYGFLNH